MHRTQSQQTKQHSTRGVALLTVLVSMLIMSLLTIEFQYSVAIERKLAYNDLNQLQAHYLAKSGARFALVRLALFARANKEPSLKNFQGLLPMLWSLPVPAFPPSGSQIKKLSKSEQDAAEKAVEETKISVGQFSQTISSESSKINLNYLIVPPAQRNGNYAISFASSTPPSTLYEYVARLLYNTISDIFKKSDNPANDFGTSRPEEVVFDIMDWVNPSSITFSGGSKDSFYERLKPPYKTKKGRFFTLDELRLVKSMEENLFKQLKPHVTVYSYDGKINLNDASNTVLKALYPDFTEDDLTKIQEEKTKIGSWQNEANFVNFVTGTLNRKGFSSLYPDPASYPFTVNSYSFIIESAGTIKKSKLTIQKKIKVAVAMTTAAGAMLKSNATNPGDCEKDPSFFWHPDFFDCRGRPTTPENCATTPGVWTQSGGVSGCAIQTANAGTFFIPPPKATNAAPNAIKILYWMES